MRIHDVHERVIDAPAAAFVPLLAAMGGPDDVLWPSPQWAPMVLDRPLGVGADGGHGLIRYRVSAYEPGRRAEFTFTGPPGLDGTHTFSVEPRGPERTLLRHVVDGHARGLFAVFWTALIRFAHDVVVEQILDRAEAALGDGPARPTGTHGIAALVARLGAPRARATAVPDAPLLASALSQVDFADAHAVARWRGQPSDPQVWVAAMLTEPPGWVAAAMRLRDRIGGGTRVRPRAVLTPISASSDEVLLGGDDRDDRALTLRASVLCERDRVVFSTTVHAHSTAGRTYLALVRAVHPLVVRALLTRAAAVLARRATAAGPIPTTH